MHFNVLLAGHCKNISYSPKSLFTAPDGFHNTFTVQKFHHPLRTVTLTHYDTWLTITTLLGEKMLSGLHNLSVKWWLSPCHGRVSVCPRVIHCTGHTGAASTRSIYTLYTAYTPLYTTPHHHNICSNSMGNFTERNCTDTRKCSMYVFCENPIRFVICCDIVLTLEFGDDQGPSQALWCQMTNVHLMKHECDIMTESWPHHDKDYLCVCWCHDISVYVVGMVLLGKYVSLTAATYHMVFPSQLQQSQLFVCERCVL